VNISVNEDEQMWTDFDWFAMDFASHIGHFTTGGFKKIPATVSCSADDLRTITAYFAELRSKSDYSISDHLDRFVTDWKGAHRESRYLKSFVRNARTGLFSYDIETYIKPDSQYFQVASPVTPLSVSDLPESIQAIIRRTSSPQRLFSSSPTIPYEETIVW